jgi:predicted dehydrogenase
LTPDKKEPDVTGRTLGVGIIGLSANGGWAAQAHVPAIATVEGLELRALSASSPASAAAAGAKYAVPAYDDPAALAHDPRVDLVVVAVKVSTHRALIETALSAGKPILCEWPLGNGAAEGHYLADIADAHGVRTFVGLQSRLTPVIRYTRDLVRDGYVGDVLSSTIVADCMSWADITTPPKAYLLDRDEGASMLAIPAGHTLDAVEMVLGPLRDVRATAAIRRPLVHLRHDPTQTHQKTVADQVALHARTDGGAVLSAHFRGGVSRTTSFQWEINGTDGDLVLRGDAGAFLEYGQVRLFGAPRGPREISPLPTPETYIEVPGLPEHGDLAFTVAHAYAQIVRELSGGASVHPDFQHAARLHDLLDSIERSATTGDYTSDNSLSAC